LRQPKILGLSFLGFVPLAGGLVKDVPFYLLKVQRNSSLLVFFLDELGQTLELSPPVEATLRGGEVREVLDLGEGGVGLVEHLLHHGRETDRALAFQEQLVVVHRVLLFDDQLDAALRHLDDTHSPSSLDIDLLHQDSFAADYRLDEHPFLGEALLHSVRPSIVHEFNQLFCCFLFNVV